MGGIKTMINIVIDFETYSECDLTKEGRIKYANHPSTDILMMSYKVEDEPTQLWLSGTEPPTFVFLWDNGKYRIHAFNAQFERIINNIVGARNYSFAPLHFRYLHDIMALCGRYGVPQSLNMAAKALGVINKGEGKHLIKLFSMGDFPGVQHLDRSRTVDPGYRQQWEQFKEYCMLDTEAEYQVMKALPADSLSEEEHKAWVLSCRINETGLPVDVKAAKQIYELTQVYLDERNNLLEDLTNGRVKRVTQVQKLREYINDLLYEARCSIRLTDLTKDTLTKMLQRDDLPDSVMELLEMRADFGLSSIGKYKRIIEMSHEGRIYDNLRYYGTHTGRWSGGGFQLLNLPRAKVSDPEAEIAKYFDHSIVYENPVKSARALIRPMVCAEAGNILYVADYGSIEYVVLEWIAGGTENLQRFANGFDQYVDMGSKIFKAAYEAVTKNQRQRAKMVILGCGYNMSVDGLMLNADMQWNIQLSEAEATLYVKSYRSDHKEVATMWPNLKEIVMTVISNPGLCLEGYKCQFKVKKDRNGNSYLCISLPSGRSMYYRDPFIGQGKFGASPGHWGTDPKTKQWSRLYLSPGRITENLVQAISRDLLVCGKHALARAGYKIIGSIYDEVICEVPSPVDKFEEFKQLFCISAPWAEGIPLLADGYSSNRYRKD